MVDVSSSGCQVQLQFGRLSPGEAVTVRPVGFGNFAGFVRWVKGDRAGIEFSPPLHRGVTEHIAKLVVTAEQHPKTFGVADHLGRRLLPTPNATVFRSVA